MTFPHVDAKIIPKNIEPKWSDNVMKFEAQNTVLTKPFLSLNLLYLPKL